MLKLKKRSQFQSIYKKGRPFREDKIILFLLSNNTGDNRIGISVTSKKTRSSVKRNRCKRLLLEGYRLTENLLKRGYDIILIAKEDISILRLDSVMDEILKLYKKSSILR